VIYYLLHILSVKLFEDYLAGKNIKGQLKPSINLLSYQEEAMIIKMCLSDIRMISDKSEAEFQQFNCGRHKGRMLISLLSA
jgi:hypothetical protein